MNCAGKMPSIPLLYSEAVQTIKADLCKTMHMEVGGWGWDLYSKQRGRFLTCKDTALKHGNQHPGFVWLQQVIHQGM